MQLLDGKVIVFGGVGDGVGHSLAIRAASHGAKVVLAARTMPRLEAIVVEVEANGGEALAVACDMTSAADCQAVAEAAVDRFGRIDGAATIACLDPDGKFFDEAADDFADWRPNLDFNFWATMQFVKACLQRMTEGGSVAIIGSTASDFPEARVAAYAASKAALASMVRSIAYEYHWKFSGGRGIRLNMLQLGAIAGPPFNHWVEEVAGKTGRTFEDQMQRVAKHYPLGHVPTPEEYADGIIFLLSDMAKAFNGLNIHANGGIFMKP